jgi:hypothetical protein
MIPQDELDDVVRAIAAENWQYVCRKLSSWKHADQYLLLSALPMRSLQEFHSNAFQIHQELTRQASEIEYSCITAVTMLRKEGVYADSKWTDPEIIKKKFQIHKIIDHQFGTVVR